MLMRRSVRCAILLAASTLPLSGCYIVPISPEGHPYGVVPIASAPPDRGMSTHSAAFAAPSPTVLQARLYPANEVAAQTGVIHGTVTNMMTGKGRFQVQYRGDTLTGEATRVNGDMRRGVASAYGKGGSYMSCEYQLHTPQQGAGTCTFSDGAKYQVHIGS